MMQARTISTHGPSVGGTVVSKNLHLKSRNRVVVRSGPINPDIRKEEAKVVDTVDVSEQDKKQVAYCRCWRSKTFPMCDGQHVKHNEEAGDNVGPLLVKK